VTAIVREKLVAWRVLVQGFEVSIVRAVSRGQARHAAVSSARDAGYQVGYGDVTVRRAPSFDAADLCPRRCYCEATIR